MENTEQLKQLLTPVVEALGVKLYDLAWRGGKDHTLEVSIMKPDGTMDLDTCAMVSEQVSAFLDEHDPSSSAYTLDVCSPGAEREIRDLNELKTIKDPYVYVRLKHPVDKTLELTGEVTAYTDGIIHLDYRVKTRTKHCEFPADDIEFIRLAVRF